MADIDFNTLVNSNIITDLTNVNFQIFANTLDNINSLDSTNITLTILADSTTNYNIVSSPTSVDFTIFPNTLLNANKVRQVIVSEPPLVILPTTFSNSDIVTNITDVVFTHVIAPNTITPSNTVGAVIIGDDKEFVLGSINNSILNIVSQCEVILQNTTVIGAYNQRAYSNRPRLQQYTFCDISMDFVPHPLTGDIANLFDKDSINQSLDNILLTNRHEHPFEDYLISSRIRSLLFELYDNGLDVEIQQEIFSAIINYEPRIYIDDIKIKSNPATNAIRVAIYYHIKTFDTIHQYTVTLDRA